MSRFPTPTGLAPLGPQMVVNPFAPSSPDFNVAQSIAMNAQRAEAQNDPEYQQALARSLYASSGLPQQPTTQRELREQQQINNSAQDEWNQIQRAARDPRNPMTQANVDELRTQHVQKWGEASINSVSPIALYNKFAEQASPELRAAKVSKALPKFLESGEWTNDMNAIIDPNDINGSLGALDKLTKMRQTKMVENAAKQHGVRLETFNEVRTSIKDEIDYLTEHFGEGGKFETEPGETWRTPPGFNSKEEYAAEYQKSRQRVRDLQEKLFGLADKLVAPQEPSTASGVKDATTGPKDEQVRAVVINSDEHFKQSMEQGLLNGATHIFYKGQLRKLKKP